MDSPNEKRELLCGTMSGRLQRLREQEAEELLAKLGLADSTIDDPFRLMIKGMKAYPHPIEIPRPFRLNLEQTTGPNDSNDE